jgi:lipopolysaccharide export system ATP-binding protein
VTAGGERTEPVISEKPEPTAPALASRGIRVARGDKAILRGVSVEAHAGEVVGVLGPSGAGKSTLFRALVGELAAEDGQILLFGEDVTRAPLWARARKGLAYVPQTPSVLWDLSVRENLRVYHRIVHGKGWLRGRVEGEDKALTTLAARVALDDHLDVRAGELSGGERRRLELARALTRPPKVLVCDEPFAGVDPRAASRIGDMLRELASTGVAVLLADHHVAEALRVCTRAILLLDGQVALDADPQTFQEDDLVVGRYLGSWARSLPPPAP